MLKRVYLAVLLSVLFLPTAFAQSTRDSLVFVNANWDVKKVSKGIVLKQYHFIGGSKLFGAPQYVSILEINTKKAKGRFALANDEGKIAPTSKFAKDSGAVVAMNGTFYNMKPPFNCVCYFKKNGVKAFANTESMSQRDNGAVAISKKGKITIEPADPSNPGGTMPQSWADRIDAPSVMCSGPVLMINGKEAMLVADSFNKNRHPRSAVAIDGNKVYLVTVDGRSAEYAQGVSLWEFAAIMRYIGVTDAINFDGGGSTTLYAEGEGEDGIVNHPSDNKQFDRLGERHVVNALLFIKK